MNFLERLLHEQYETDDGEPVVFRCSECGYQSLSLGQLHGHAEQHRDMALDPFGLIVPPWRWANVDELMEFTEVRTLGREVPIEEVDNAQ